MMILLKIHQPGSKSFVVTTVTQDPSWVTLEFNESIWGQQARPWGSGRRGTQRQGHMCMRFHKRFRQEDQGGWSPRLKRHRLLFPLWVLWLSQHPSYNSIQAPPHGYPLSLYCGNFKLLTANFFNPPSVEGLKSSMIKMENSIKNEYEVFLYKPWTVLFKEHT